jgi:hypothetical protein
MLLHASADLTCSPRASNTKATENKNMESKCGVHSEERGEGSSVATPTCATTKHTSMSNLDDCVEKARTSAPT